MRQSRNFTQATLGRLGPPEEIADAVTFLVGHPGRWTAKISPPTAASSAGRLSRAPASKRRRSAVPANPTQKSSSFAGT